MSLFAVVTLFRCYLVWGKSWKVVVLPLVLLCGFIGGLVSLPSVAEAGGS